jgi:hypothetical protein
MTDSGSAFDVPGPENDAGQPPAGDGTPALRGHPGGPGFVPPDDLPATRPAMPARSVWQQAQGAWRAAGAEWRRPSRPREPSPARETLPPGEPFRTAEPFGIGEPFHAGANFPSHGNLSMEGEPFRGGATFQVPAWSHTSAPAGAGFGRPLGRRWKPRRGVLVVAGAVVVAAALAVAGVAAFGIGAGGPPVYPAARLAAGMFGTGQAQAGRGVFQSVSRVASSGDTVVAVSSQTGGDVPRAQFFVSRDGGSTWRLSAVRAPGGGAPAPGHPAQLIAGGSGDWLAVGPQAVWTSRNGQSWTLSSSSGITPADTGDQVWVLTQTAGGFLAAGQNAAEGTAVIWTSRDGVHWQRMTAPQVLLPAGGGRVLTINYAAARGPGIVISGEVATTTSAGHGKQRHTVVIRSAGTWLSTDDGTSWRPSPVPVSHGAGPSFSGVAADAAGFIAIRPGTTTVRHGLSVRTQPDGVVYTSATGSAWRYAGTLTAPGGLHVGVVKGGAGGFTAVGQGSGGQLAAYRSANGASWRPAAALGTSSARAVTGATVTASGAVIAAGYSVGADSQQPYLAVAPPGQGTRAVDFAAIPGATIAQVAVNAVGVAAGRQVAVGEAGGAPAIWSRTGRGAWSLVSGAPPAAAAGSQELTSVAHGPAGWLATGDTVSAATATGTATGTAQHPVVVTSADGTTWQAAPGTFGGANVSASQAAAGRSGYVIVGAGVTAAGTFPAAWWSGDLGTWSRAGGPAPGAAALGGAGQMLGVAAGPSGFVAVGQRGIHPAVWTSGDGQTWHAASLPVPAGQVGAELQQVAVSGRRVVALGEKTSASGAGAAFAEVSADGGATWRPAPLPAPHGPATVTAVTAAAGGFTAVGTYGRPGHLNVAVWTSPDGARWTASTPHGTGLSGAGIQEITGLAATDGSTLTGVGFTATQDGEQPTLWDVPAR